jgi:hypothetical protein
VVRVGVGQFPRNDNRLIAARTRRLKSKQQQSCEAQLWVQQRRSTGRTRREGGHLPCWNLFERRLWRYAGMTLRKKAIEGLRAALEIHKPKPVHSWREFANEVGVIVLGIVIALSGEQILEAIHWKHKVAGAEQDLRRELADSLSYAVEQQQMSECVSDYLALLQHAILQNDAATIEKLHEIGIPLDAHPWRSSSWTAALSGQVADHLPHDRVAAYSVAFRLVTAGGEWQNLVADHYAEAMTGRFGLPRDPQVVNAQLVAVDKIRREEAQRLDISETLVRTSRQNLHLTPSTTRQTEFQNRVNSCQDGLHSLNAKN